jgi:hypothetical protein
MAFLVGLISSATTFFLAKLQVFQIFLLFLLFVILTIKLAKSRLKAGLF